jgi:hypothetical protein
MARPKSPSCRRLEDEPRPIAFGSYDDIEHLLAGAIVGTSKYSKALLAYRVCSKAMLAAVDAAVDMWCIHFRALQNTYVASASESNSDQEETYRSIVRLETSAKNAFGSIGGCMRSFVHLSKVDRVTYYSALLNKCVLCGGKMASSSTVEDAEDPCSMPCYTFSHSGCQRKHMVVIAQGTSPIPKGVEPRELHKELYAVACSRPGGVSVDRQSVLSLMSKWYRSSAGKARFAAPLMVWLRPHHRVRVEDTLYGALGVTEEQVKSAVAKQEDHGKTMREQSDARRMTVARKTQELSEAYEAEIRVWLGKGKTMWRNLEELQGLHEDVLSSTHVDRLIDPAQRKTVAPGLHATMNTLLLLSRSIEMMEKPPSVALVDWLVRSAGVVTVFGNMGYEVQHVDRDLFEVAVHNEALVHAKALDYVESIDPASVSCEDVSAAGGGFFRDSMYNITVKISKGQLTYTTCFAITHTDACKIKYTVASFLPEKMQQALPPLPPMKCAVIQVKDYFEGILKICMTRESGMARGVVLGHIVTVALFKQVVGSISLVLSDGPHFWSAGSGSPLESDSDE